MKRWCGGSRQMNDYCCCNIFFCRKWCEDIHPVVKKRPVYDELARAIRAIVCQYERSWDEREKRNHQTIGNYRIGLIAGPSRAAAGPSCLQWKWRADKSERGQQTGALAVIERAHWHWIIYGPAQANDASPAAILAIAIAGWMTTAPKFQSSVYTLLAASVSSSSSSTGSLFLSL